MPLRLAAQLAGNAHGYCFAGRYFFETTYSAYGSVPRLVSGRHIDEKKPAMSVVVAGFFHVSPI
jgi:hypothetical protein